MTILTRLIHFLARSAPQPRTLRYWLLTELEIIRAKLYPVKLTEEEKARNDRELEKGR